MIDTPCGLLVWIESILMALLLEVVLILNWPSCALNQEKSSIEISRLGIESGPLIFLLAEVLLTCVASGGTSGTRKRLKVPVRLPLGFAWLAPKYWICPLACGELTRTCKTSLFWLVVILTSCHGRSIKMNFFACTTICI